MTPYVTTTLQVKWIDQAPDSTGDQTAPSFLFFGDSPLPFYRFTPAVCAWFDRKVSAALENDAARAALTRSPEAFIAFLHLWHWAEDTYGGDAIAAAVPGLPQVTNPPPRDVPPVDPVVWGGAFDAPKAREVVPVAPVGVQVAVSPPIADSWGGAKPRRTTVGSTGKRKRREAAVSTPVATGGLFS
jgi:hypothetical protein